MDMSLTTKAFLIAVPIAVLLQVIVLMIGFTIYRENLYVPATNIIGICSGLLAFFQVKKNLERKQSK
ncbi:TPA: hypothetical protein P7K80_001910 [Vibrio cholerae]|nr:hypothetical protein [Vibrio cholerae]HAS4086079.1 hypothetical protein [Vibrio cholerae]HAS4101255.1 hypothetical protein [Vibrio cholerae]HAS4176125.1 hypothetical protein [Vibrio cholerae]HBC2323639.1 hypothetical protein [Vibrio cholerae]